MKFYVVYVKNNGFKRGEVMDFPEVKTKSPSKSQMDMMLAFAYQGANPDETIMEYKLLNDNELVR